MKVLSCLKCMSCRVTDTRLPCYVGIAYTITIDGTEMFRIREIAGRGRAMKVTERIRASKPSSVGAATFSISRRLEPWVLWRKMP